ncbi:SDR family NAD-dependent epimerase/dehydratase [candidate division WOR-3 bacterium]|uniref:SDR family NAD-dependent epimerase/dehydratase n=1 Tax=candidate division WOR-3 bacterium TaxID=2052148 RepID=A0A660SK94_UNCW3|nr:MAG: SDR family NAD-dependent epimerase/dehydratase [candidate division WOR-3 bacterium]
MRVLITGGAGFIGSHLVDFYLREGAEVVVVDNLITGSRENLSDHKRLTLVEEDVSGKLSVTGPFDLIFHLASPASPKDYLRLPIETLRTGSVGTINTLELARSCRARYILASTSEVYGDPQVHPQEESYFGNVNPVGPRSVYDEAKRFAEAVTFAYQRKYGLKTTIIRIFNTYGPRMKKEDGRAIPTFFAQALRNEPITVFGDGNQTRSFCYIDDLIRGMVGLTRIDHPGPINLGNPDEYRIIELATMIKEITNSASPITFAPPLEDDPRRRCPDISLVRSLIGWQPEIPLKEGLRRYYEWIRDI